MNYSKYFIADKGYCSTKIRDILKTKNILPIIPFNKRNTKRALRRAWFCIAEGDSSSRAWY